MKTPVYVLGTSLSHDGSVCLLKDGKICAAIEKERITRIKHDGRNDKEAIAYCLEKENISFEDLHLIVQNSPDGFYSFPRVIKEDCPVPVITISHHLAHAYSAYGACKFDECAVLVIDGSGNSIKDCMDMDNGGALLNGRIPAEEQGRYYENNSYYHFEGGRYNLINREASREWDRKKEYISPYTVNSIGDFYGAVSAYCFKDMFDAGKVMGLAPYGDPNAIREELFYIDDRLITIDESVLMKFNEPSRSFDDFKRRFGYFANVANWAQRELERAVLHIINSRYESCSSENLAYAGGVALNAVINGKILQRTPFKRLYIQPAAGDNGVSLGCAFYGWLEVVKGKKVEQSGASCFGKVYKTDRVKKSISQFHIKDPVLIREEIDRFFYGITKKDEETNGGSDSMLLQFNIEDAGVYQVGIDSKGVRSYKGGRGQPTSVVSMRNKDLYQGILNPAHFRDLYNMDRITITNPVEFVRFMNVVKLTSDQHRKDEEQPAGYLKYIHYEGDGYIQETARLLAEGKIIGWFQDESEFGPRALGRRSILADPRIKGVKDFINAEIKHREDYRPFAPSVLKEDVGQYFQTDEEAPYMLTVAAVRDKWRNILEDVVHKDGTCRIQTVTPDWNPKYASLLSEFKKIAGISVLLNTSFNGKGMPIVETPEDAFCFFHNSKLDYLVIQDLIIKQIHS